MCGYMMTVDMYDMICVVAEYVSIQVHMYAEVVDVFTITLMYRDVMEERIETTVCKEFSRGSVYLDHIEPNWQSDKIIALCWCIIYKIYIYNYEFVSVLAYE